MAHLPMAHLPDSRRMECLPEFLPERPLIRPALLRITEVLFLRQRKLRWLPRADGHKPLVEDILRTVRFIRAVFFTFEKIILHIKTDKELL
jgi:hypothetical protein